VRAVFCGGGTGGHVYPALTVAQALRELRTGQETALLYIGVSGKIDADLVARDGMSFQAVGARPLRTGDFQGRAVGAMAAAGATAEALRILRRFRPDIVFATGGYGSVGTAMAAKILRCPLLLFLPDVDAGLAVKLLARVADKIAVTVDAALASVPASKAAVTGYPVRPEFFRVDRAEARRRFGLHDELPTLLVSGASSGASAINQAVAEMASDFLRIGQILHISGGRDLADLEAARSRLPEDRATGWQIHAYLHDEMAQALGAADLAVMRSGASTLGELPAAKLPAVLVPGEYEGWDQSPNARYLENQGAARALPQSRLSELQATVMNLLGDSDARLAMQDALSRLAQPEAAMNLAQLMMQMAETRVKVPAG
jgi:UDP-N-acetylglucosamine--N-acetylmuramyl-(pentapeptide) pyrophosphoryl-undecaprenol N-acetylglucosamine transferase